MSVCVFEVLVCSGVVILFYEAKILFSLALKHQLSTFLVGWQVTLSDRDESRGSSDEQNVTGVPGKRKKIHFFQSL